ncbi:serine/threonine-protein kinase [Marinobacter salicampi]|uniref:serine/threonine-protein kinase n=1 Tax=Marinobacter salicampi TaxID=435907 RepID=UPI001F5F9933|nr:serine/threonine-protein kinase [Marinobacter salicampi]
MAFALVVGLAILPVGPDLSGLGQLDRSLYDLVTSASASSSGLTAEQFSALLSAKAIQVPSWALHALIACLGLSALFLVALVPAMTTPMASLVTVLLIAAMFIGQSVLLLYRQTWLPLGPVITFLGAGFVIMLFWLRPYRQIQALENNVLDARYQLARLLLQKGESDGALAALAQCPADDDILDLQYDIAIALERKRNYEAAARTYHQIIASSRNFRDVKERLASVEQVTTHYSDSGTVSLEATRTLVMPDQKVSKPTLGRYQVERELGRGAMGVVYLGKDPRIARTVAIKTFSYSQFEGAELADLKARFFREAEAAGRLNHPDIVTVYDVGEEADLAFIAMDYASGKPLSAFSKPKGLLPLPVVLDLMARVAEALDYAHSQKIVHRDIKPGNIIFNPKSGDMKITDFGIARITDDSATRTGSIMGSPLYMSPEQLKGQKVTGASDIYSLGVTLYRLLSGQTPFQGDSLANLTYQVLNKRPRSVREFQPDVPDAAVRIINKAIQREPGKRFASAGEMAQALRRAAARHTSKEAS